MSRRRLAWLIAGATVAVLFQVLTDYVNTWPGPPPQPIYVLTPVVVGLSYLVAGLVGWHRRPEERIGLVFMIVGFVWYLPALANVRSPLPFTIGNVVGGLYTAGLAHLALAWPSGYLRSRTQRAVVVSNYVWTLASSIAGTLFWNPRANGCSAACPANLILLDSSARLQDAASAVTTPVSFAITVVVVVLIVHNWRSSQGYARREMTPLIWVAVPVAAFVVAQNTVENFNLPVSSVLMFGVFPLVLVLPPLAFLFSLVQAGLARRTVGSALVNLEPGPAPKRLHETLAAALGDSTLLLAFRRPGGGYIDTNECMVDIVHMDSSRVVAELDPAGEAVLVYNERLQYEPQLVKVAVHVASLALQHARLQAEVTAQLHQVYASRARIVEAGDMARRRLERDLHDGAQQRLVTLSMALGMARDRAGALDPELASLLDAASNEARQALVELRELARGIHPAVLTEAGLQGALLALVERAPIATTLLGVTSERFSGPIEATAYFVVSEALANVAKHADANSAVVTITRSAGVLVVEVGDDGRGGARPDAGSGLRGLADRVASVAGDLRIDSPLGGGTRVVAEIPCP